MSTPDFSPAGVKPAPLNEAAIALVARRFAVLSEPMRLRLIHALFAGERSVNELVDLTGGTQTNISRHLQTLAQAGIVGRRKEGLQTIYAITDPSIGQLCELVCGCLKQQLSSQVDALAP